MAKIKFVLKDNYVEFPYNGKPQSLQMTRVLLDHKKQNNGTIFAIGQDIVVMILPFTPLASNPGLKPNGKECLQDKDAEDNVVNNDRHGDYEHIGRPSFGMTHLDTILRSDEFI
ncbi:hypothetical protein FBU30_010366 [Linnemannia zychae]|nr:hypothetical protein FBU30_010366 [Linnemannia zychae]